MKPVPESLMNSLSELPGFDRTAFQTVHALPAVLTSIRVNPAKPLLGRIQAEEPVFPHHPLELSRIPWTSYGYYLSDRPVFTLDPLLHAGCYYVQEASSMLLEQAIRQTIDIQQPISSLDLCAAPGGKSSLIQSLLSPDSVLISNEVIKSRAGILEENLSKWGGANLVITNNDPKDFSRMTGIADLLLIDAPCSGSGLFRRDPDAIEEWSEQNVLLCSQRQQRILADALPALKEGGVLIYSTCSYSEAENEAIADWLLRHFELESLPLAVEPHWGMVETQSPQRGASGYRCWPHLVNGEGFYLACFRKTGAPEKTKFADHRKSKLEPATRSEQSLLNEWLATDNWKLVRIGEGFLGMPEATAQMLSQLSSSGIYVRQSGIRLGKLAGKGMVPDPALALSGQVSLSVNRLDLDYQQALQYLRREELELPQGSEPGWALATYTGVPLGWVKLLSNRVNNYWKKEWRIRMTSPQG